MVKLLARLSLLTGAVLLFFYFGVGTTMAADTPQSGSISGSVCDESGLPVAEARIFVRDFNDRTYITDAQSDANGQYTLQGLSSGQYLVYAQKYGLVRRFYNDTLDPNKATPVEISDGDNIKNINFTLEKGGTIAGVIENADGTLLGGIGIEADLMDGVGSYGAISEANGSYTIVGLPYGSYKIFSPAGFGSNDTDWIRQFYKGKTSSDEADPVAIASGSPNVTGIDFSLTRNSSISGTIKDNDGTPLAGADVWAEDFDNGTWLAGGQSDSKGQYTLQGLSAGHYRVSAQKHGWVKKLYDNTLNYHSASPVEVQSPGQNITGIDFTLEPGGTISGVVKDAAGNCLPNVSVNCERIDGDGGYGAETASDGTYTLIGLPYGSYRVRSPEGFAANDGSWARQYYQGKTGSDGADLVEITSDNPNVQDIDFSLTQGSSISGTIKDDSGSPIANADVWASGFDNDTWVAGGQSDSNGHYTLQNMGIGQYRIGARADGRVQKFYLNTLNHDDASLVEIQSLGQNITGIDFTLEAGGTISGVVKDAEGNTLANVSVNCERTDGPGGNGTETASDGTYTLAGLPYGSYRVRCPEGFGDNDAGWGQQYYNGKTSSGESDLVSLSSGIPNVAEIDFSLSHKNGSIKGTVKNQSGSPIANAHVWVENWDDGTIIGGDETDSNGQYEIKGLGLGKYRLAARAAGHVRYFYQNVFHRDSATALYIDSADKAFTGMDFALPPGGTISGVVKAADGTPLPDISVRCRRTDGGGANIATTGADGTYTVYGLPFGSYQVISPVSLGSNDAGWMQQFYKGKTSSDEADPVTVSSGSPTVTGIDFSLNKSSSISGTIKDESGNPIASVDIWAEDFDNGTWVAGGQSDSKGQYTLQGLSTGRYRVSAQKYGWVKKLYDNTLNYNDASPLDIQSLGQNITDIDFTLAPGGTISGVVKDAAGNVLGNVSVNCERTDGDGGNGTETASDGTYTLIGLPYGSYRVRSPEGFAANDTGWARQYYKEKTTSDGANLVPVSSSSPNVKDIDFSLTQSSSISGTIKDDSGNSVANADIWASTFDNDTWAAGARSDSNGNYTLQSMGIGQYRIAARADGRVQEFYLNTLNHDDASLVEIQSLGQNITGIDFTLEAGGTISGVVKDAEGNTLANVSVYCERTDGPGGNGTETASDGTYTLAGLPYGSYRVRCPEGFGDNDAGWGQQYYNGKTSSDEADLVTLSSGSPNVAEIDFSLSHKNGSIKGTVKNQSGSPIANAYVWAGNWDDGTLIGEDETDSNGQYEIKGLGLGKYRLAARAAGHVRYFYQNVFNRDNATPIYIDSADKTITGMDFALPPGGSITGVVKDAEGNPLPNVSVRCLRTDGGGGNIATTDADGTYTEYGLPFGSYQVISPVGLGNNDAGWMQQFYNGKSDSDQADPVAVVSGSPNVTGISFSLSPVKNGDVNKNSSIDGFDALDILLHEGELDDLMHPAAIKVIEDIPQIADVNNDSAVNGFDALDILLYEAQLYNQMSQASKLSLGII